MIANVTDAELPVVAEEIGAYLSSRVAPTGWVNAALGRRIPGVDDLRADVALKNKRAAVLTQNHNSLTKAFAAGTPTPALLDPYSPTITSEPYANGEVFQP